MWEKGEKRLITVKVTLSGENSNLSPYIAKLMFIVIISLI